MKNILLLVATVAISFVLFVGCNKSVSENDSVELSTEIQGTDNFIASIKTINLPQTKSGELSDEDIILLEQAIAPLFPLAISYLEENGYDYHDDFEDNDPCIILTAYGLAEYDIMNLETKSTWDDIAAVGACILLGSDTYALGKLAAKQIAKLVLKKAIPYVGAALGVVEATACIIGYFD